MRQHSRRVRFAWFQFGESDWLFSGKIPHSHRRDLHRRFRESGNAQDRTRGRHTRKNVGEYFVQRPVLIYIFEIDLDINDVIHGQPRRLDYGSHILETLANLIGKVRWNAAVAEARALPREIHIVSGVDSEGT